MPLEVTVAVSFPDQLRSIRDKNHSKDHPFFELWAQGKLTNKQTALYCIQHHHYVTDYINWLAYESSQIPNRDVKAYLFENLGDEESKEDRHLDMLTDYVGVCGFRPEDVENGKNLPTTQALQNWGWRLVYQWPWQAALAGMFIGLESQFLDICKKIVPALHNHYGWSPGARQIRFFEQHITADEIHGRKGLAIVQKYCTTQEHMELALKAVEEATRKRWEYMNGIYRFAVEGREDDTPAL